MPTPPREPRRLAPNRLGPTILEGARRLGVGLVIAASLMGGLEGALRLARFEHLAVEPIVIVPFWPSFDARRMERLQALYRFHPYWFWELRPGATVPDCGAERINAAGYRGPQRPRPPTPGVLRIALLGDSSTFGMGVCEDHTFAALLERALPDTEVLNFGVIGFSAFQGEKLLEGRALSYRPQVILAAFGAVDELLPASGYDVDDKFALTSRVDPRLAVWRDRLRALRVFQLVERALAGRSDRQEVERRARENLDKWNRGSGDYLPNQGVPSFERSLERIVGLGRSRGARVALIVPPRRTALETLWPWATEGYSAAIERVASRLDAPAWDARAAFRAVPASDERLFLDQFHPNVPGHQLYARFLAGKIRDELGGPGREARTHPQAPGL
jgi:hypothetical protein